MRSAEVNQLFKSADGRYWLVQKDGRRWFFNSRDLIGILVLTDSILVAVYRATDDLRAWIRLYGLTGGLAVAIFGNKSVWILQAELLSSLSNPDNSGGPLDLEFKKITLEESSRIGITGTIITQVAITALGLPNLSRTHWVVRASYLFSLLSALLAVYYAGNRVWKIGRLLPGSQLRVWVRNSDRSMEDVLAETKTSDEKTRLKSIVRSLAPAPSSVLTVSAPGLLLSAALRFQLVGFGIYLCFVWKRGLDISAGPNDSRNVFVVYLVGVSVCYGVYTVSG
ncbi:hypothetical protein K469DRAFT_556012, partial [Zopfia rhizophila CBS 207.26]